MVFLATWRRLAVCLALTTVLFGTGLLALHAASAAAVATPLSVEEPVVEDPSAMPGKLVIGMPSDIDATALNTLLARHGARVERWLLRLGLALVSVPAGDEATVATALAAEPAVEFVGHHRRLARIADTPLDEYWSLQWGPAKVAAPAAWDLIEAVPSVVIAIIDTGVHMEHVDLRDRQWLNPGESGIDLVSGERTCDAPIAYNGEDDDANGYVDDCRGYDFVERDNTPADRNGHGTVVAGIAAAAVNNPDSADPGSYEGIAGMGRNAHFMALRSLDAYGRGYALDIAEAIDYAAASGAQVVNLSLTYPPTTPPSSADVLILQKAVEAAQASGVLLVAAAGNEKYNGIDYPARFPGVLAVGASTRQDARAAFSNYGSRLDLLAPGEGIYSTLLYSGVRSYGYYNSTGSGTSFAAPHVAGVAALVRAMRPDLAQSAVYELIRHTADDVGDPGFDNQSGWGRLNAQRAVSEAISGLRLGLVADPPTLALGSTGTVSLSITSPSGGSAGLGARLTLSSSLGSITPTIVTADSSGEALVSLVGDLFPGTAHITATLGNLTATLPVTITSRTFLSLIVR